MHFNTCSVIIFFGLFGLTNYVCYSMNPDDDWSMIMEIEVEDSTETRTNKSVTKNERYQQVTEVTSRYFQEPGTTICGQNVCYNWARCYKASNSQIECLCQIGYSGKLCEKMNNGYRFPKIQKGGYLKLLIGINKNDQLKQEHYLNNKLKINNNSWKQNLLPNYLIEFEMNIHHSETTFLIVFFTSFDRLTQSSLSLENGYLMHRQLIHIDGNNSKMRKEIREIRHSTEIHNDQWYHVGFGTTDQGHIFIILNGTKHIDDYSMTIPRFPDTYNDHYHHQAKSSDFIYIGGHPSLNDSTRPIEFLGNPFSHNFVGCIQNIFIDKKPIDLRRKSFVGDIVDGYGIVDCAEGLCDIMNCQHNGTCIVTSGSTAICQCPIGIVGTHCDERIQIRIPSYHGNSYTEYNGLKGSSSSFTTLTIEFLPTGPDGLLLYEGFSNDKRGDFLAVVLIQSRIYVGFDLGSGSTFIRSWEQLKLNEWHTMQFWRIGRQGFLRIDSDKVLVTNFSVGSFLQLTLTYSLYLGGYPDSDFLTAFFVQYLIEQQTFIKGFHGCINKVEFNGITIDPVKDALKAINLKNCVGKLCAEPKFICHNQGTCNQNFNSSKCLCPLGYSGLYCETKLSMRHIHTISFQGSSFLEFSNNLLKYRTHNQYYHISFEIKPENISFLHSDFKHSYIKSIKKIDQILLYAKFESKSGLHNILIKLNLNGQLFMIIESNAFKYQSITSELKSNLQSHSDFKNENQWDSLKQRIWNQKVAFTDNLYFKNTWHKFLLTLGPSGYVLFINRTQVANLQFNEHSHGIELKGFYLGGIGEQLKAQRRFMKLTSLSDNNNNYYLNLQNTEYEDHGFYGCMKNLEINGNLVNMYDANNGQNIKQCV